MGFKSLVMGESLCSASSIEACWWALEDPLNIPSTIWWHSNCQNLNPTMVRGCGFVKQCLPTSGSWLLGRIFLEPVESNLFGIVLLFPQTNKCLSNSRSCCQLGLLVPDCCFWSPVLFSFTAFLTQGVHHKFEDRYQSRQWQLCSNNSRQPP